MHACMPTRVGVVMALICSYLVLFLMLSVTLHHLIDSIVLSLLCLLQIEMGSTNIRVGSTIFGARDYSKQ
jgi:hypothetical protein